jgi:hypothetical protein
MFYKALNFLLGSDIRKCHAKQLCLQAFTMIVSVFVTITGSHLLSIFVSLLIILNLVVDVYITKTIKRREENIEAKKDQGNITRMVCPICHNAVYHNKKTNELK